MILVSVICSYHMLVPYNIKTNVTIYILYISNKLLVKICFLCVRINRLILLVQLSTLKDVAISKIDFSFCFQDSLQYFFSSIDLNIRGTILSSFFSIIHYGVMFQLLYQLLKLLQVKLQKEKVNDNIVLNKDIHDVRCMFLFFIVVAFLMVLAPLHLLPCLQIIVKTN